MFAYWTNSASNVAFFALPRTENEAASRRPMIIILIADN